MPFPLIPLLLNAAPSLIQAFTGKKENAASGVVEQVSKGLLHSKTARDATFTLGAKVMGILVLPLPTWLQWLLVAAVFIEWAAQLYRRVKTSEPVV